METHICLELSNGDNYAIPLSIVAKDRAKHYSRNKGLESYNEEFDFIMQYPDEGIDWLENNMTWQMVKDEAFLIKPSIPTIDYDNELCNCNKNIISIP